MAKRPTIAIPLDLPDVEALRTDVSPELLIEVRRTLTSTTCRKCQRTITDSAGTDRPIRLRYLTILGMQVWSADPYEPDTRADRPRATPC